MKVPPAGADDRCLLSKILLFLGRILKSLPKVNLINDDLFVAIHDVLLQILQEQVHGEGGRMKYVQNGDTTSMGLATEIIGFLAAIFRRLDAAQLSKLVSYSKCVDTIADFAYFVFSSDNTLTRSHFLRLNCLSCILSFASLSSLLSVANADTICNLIRLLVQITGSFQKTFANFVDGNSFTYKDGCAYKWTVLCLRNLSRTVIAFESNQNTWIWGDQWLYANDIEWLLTLLNDDEKMIQKFGLGILSNLILM